MKKYLILLCAVSALFACGKMGTEVETPAEAGIPVSDLVFDLSVEYTAETKATKQGWENGDAVFVFFQTISDYYLKMTYDGTKWNTVLASPGGSFPSTINTQGKTVTAVYRPLEAAICLTTPQMDGDSPPNTRTIWLVRKCPIRLPKRATSG